MRFSRPLVVAIVALVLNAAASPAEIYRWTDTAGVVHYDDDIARVPESERGAVRVFQSKVVVQGDLATASGPTQAGFAGAMARDLGLQASDLQDPVSVLHIVGIYPAIGWHPAAPLTPAVVQEVVTAARAAARARRLGYSERGAEAAVLRAAAGLGVAGPPASAPPDPPAPPAPPSIVVAPNIVVESPPVVVVERVERQPVPVFADYPHFVFGVPFAPLPGPPVVGPVPERITPLFNPINPTGRLNGSSVTPLGSSSFTRPANF